MIDETRHSSPAIIPSLGGGEVEPSSAGLPNTEDLEREKVIEPSVISAKQLEEDDEYFIGLINNCRP